MATSLEHTGDHVRARQYLREAATILAERNDPHAEVLLKRAGSGADAAGTVANPTGASRRRSVPARSHGWIGRASVCGLPTDGAANVPSLALPLRP